MSDTYSVFERLGLPLAIASGDKLVYANPALAALIGVDRSRLVGGAISSLIGSHVPSTDLPAMQDVHSRTLAGTRTPQPVLATRIHDATGTLRAVQIHSSEGPGEGEWTYVITEADLDGQRLTSALANAAAQLVQCRDEEAVLDTAVRILSEQGFTCAVLTLEGDFFRQAAVRVHPQAEAMAEALTGKKMSEWKFPLEQLPHFKEMLRTGRSAFIDDIFVVVEKIHTPEIMKVLRDHVPPAHSVDAPVLVDGQPFGILSMQSQTVTAAANGPFELFARCVGNAIENVRHHRHQAEQLDELKRLQRELLQQERLSALGEAARVVSHEVRNPIGAIINAVAVLKKVGKGDHSNLLWMIEEEALRLDCLVRDLLELARPLDPRPIPVAVEELIEKVKVLAHTRDEGKRLAVSCDAAEAKAIEADPPLLHLALENLVRNALQASPPLGKVLVTFAEAPDRCLIAVEDQGAGILEAEEHRIFEPFYTTRARGTGLGLAVVKRVAEVHGAQIRVSRSKLGGARFELEFPRRTSAH